MSYYETIKAIEEVKKYFEKEIEKKLNLTKVGSPLFVTPKSGLQDNLSGIEKAVYFEKDKQKFVSKKQSTKQVFEYDWLNETKNS